MATLQYHWDFHEGSGNDVADIVGANEGTRRYGTSGTLGEGPTWVSGPAGIGYALRFDGNDDFVATTTKLTNPQNFSLTGRFKTSIASGQKILGFEYFQIGDSRTYPYDRHIYIDTDGYLRYGVWIGSAATAISIAPVTDGKWHHFAVLEGTGAGETDLYLDCIYQDTVTGAGQSYEGYWRIGGSAMSTQWPKSANTWSAFNGDITDVRIYSGNLTSEEICALAKLPATNAHMFSCNT